jgi:hypothetical protein
VPQLFLLVEQDLNLFVLGIVVRHFGGFPLVLQQLDAFAQKFSLLFVVLLNAVNFLAVALLSLDH